MLIQNFFSFAFVAHVMPPRPSDASNIAYVTLQVMLIQNIYTFINVYDFDTERAYL